MGSRKHLVERKWEGAADDLKICHKLFQAGDFGANGAVVGLGTSVPKTIHGPSSLYLSDALERPMFKSLHAATAIKLKDASTNHSLPPVNPSSAHADNVRIIPTIRF
ncbi:hypothetical protein [Mesorhizobium sp. ZC-5]|uniref:hypothetical protein n=1 Tax=Mesorhizobium sp. ZC-5 TaxID=2986066 RepID=UPI0021E74863|nr:hypothetical protein [Mesorhizobium sp. ZC-5]MCV3240639.1 hypothetical protein [Mesorhizobium sp. ZC-5]